MTVFLFLISVYAALLGPVAAIGGVAMALLWVLHRYTWASVAFSTTFVALCWRSSLANPDGEMGAHLYYMGSHLCAVAVWAAFAAVMSRMLPEETPAGRRLWLQKRARLEELEANSAQRTSADSFKPYQF